MLKRDQNVGWDGVIHAQIQFGLLQANGRLYGGTGIISSTFQLQNQSIAKIPEELEVKLTSQYNHINTVWSVPFGIVVCSLMMLL